MEGSADFPLVPQALLLSLSWLQHPCPELSLFWMCLPRVCPQSQPWGRTLMVLALLSVLWPGV